VSVDARSIALIAHDAQKEAMVTLVERHLSLLTHLPLVATHTTGTLINTRTGIDIAVVLSGPQGGDLQIGAMVATNQIRALLFLRDPLTAHPHEPDISALLKVCDIHNVPLATNLATAHIILKEVAEEIASQRGV
jgi:methylglyoxal synthase